MPARSIGSATISFGLVSVPVSLFSTSESSVSVSFNMLDKKTGTRLKQQYVVPTDKNRVVEKDEIAKGYEFSKGQYVVFSPEELKALDEKATNSIDIAEFVPLDKIDRVYLEKAYFLGPDKGGERAYHLLAKALEETGRAALGQYAARGKQNLVLVRPTADGVLVMEQLHYADELKKASEVPIPEATVKDTELKLAKQLIEQTATDEFHPEKYHDQVRDRVHAGHPGQGGWAGNHLGARRTGADQDHRPHGGAEGEPVEGRCQGQGRRGRDRQAGKEEGAEVGLALQPQFVEELCPAGGHTMPFMDARQHQPVLGARHPHVEQPARLFHVTLRHLLALPDARHFCILHTHDVDPLELEPLGRVQRQQVDPVMIRLHFGGV